MRVKEPIIKNIKLQEARVNAARFLDNLRQAPEKRRLQDGGRVCGEVA